MANIFQGKQVRLRAVEPTDWQLLDALDWSDTDGARMGYEIRFPESRDLARMWAENEAKRSGDDDKFIFQIERLEGELIGSIGVHTVNRRCGTFMYGLSIRPAHRRQGYAFEAIPLVLRYYFHERRYQKVNAEVYAFNDASVHLHEKLGFVLEGRLRRMIYTNGQFHDVLFYGMTREEFDARNFILNEAGI